MKRSPLSSWAAALVLSLGSASLQAQVQRDPTQPPPEISAPHGGSAPSSLLGTDGMTVVVRDGKSFLAVGTRLYAPGQKVGALRVERITETEVWLRDGKSLQKVPRFAGIQRTESAPLPAPAARKPKAAKNLKRHEHHE